MPTSWRISPCATKTNNVRYQLAADTHSPSAAALISAQVFNGCRISEALSADLTDYRHDRGHRVLRICRKGDKRASVALPRPPSVRWMT